MTFSQNGILLLIIDFAVKLLGEGIKP